MDTQSTQADADRLSEALSRLRIQQRLSQVDLKRLSGVSRETISIVERAHDPKKKGPPRPHSDILKALAGGLATDGKGEMHEDLRDHFYAELMAAAGYLPAGLVPALSGDTALIRTEAEIERWAKEQVGDQEFAVAYARAPGARRYLSPAEQIAFDNTLKLWLEKADRNRRGGRG